MWMEWTSHIYECVCSVNIKFIANWHSEKSNITCLKVGLTEKVVLKAISNWEIGKLRIRDYVRKCPGANSESV